MNASTTKERIGIVGVGRMGLAMLKPNFDTSAFEQRAKPTKCCVF
jgi:pyrroline-5-carboxylate reductase